MVAIDRLPLTPMPAITTQSLRHSFATACVNAGVEVTKLSAMMGHRDVATTQQYYVKQKLRDLHSAAGDIDGALGKALLRGAE